jgi:hypothetical protein
LNTFLLVACKIGEIPCRKRKFPVKAGNFMDIFMGFAARRRGFIPAASPRFLSISIVRRRKDIFCNEPRAQIPNVRLRWNWFDFGDKGILKD